MSLKSKIEAVIYASEEPVTLAQLVGLLSEEAQAELDAVAALQTDLPLGDAAPGNDTAAVTHPDHAAQDTGSLLPRPTEGTTEQAQVEPNSALTELQVAPVQHSSTDGAVAVADEEAAAADAPSTDAQKRQARERERALRDYLREIIDALIREYAETDRGLEIREVAGGFRFGTKPEYHDAVRGFVKSLKPALKLSLQALETLAVVAYKQPVTAAEISEIRGVDSAGVLGGLLTRKLIQTAGRKQVIGRPMLYKTTKEFLVRFGLRDVQELPSMEEFERMAGELAEQEDLPMEETDNIIERANARGDAEHIREANDSAGADASPAAEAGGSTGSENEPSSDATQHPPPEPGRSEGNSSAASEAQPASEQDPQ